MSTWTLLLIALGVSADAFAVALGKGLQMRSLRRRDAFTLAVTFGLFQALMPVIGWLLGKGFRDYIVDVDHWIAFTLLALIGVKMIWDALHPDDDEAAPVDGIPLRELLVLGVATSIDALAVGISFAFLDVAIAGAATSIGVTTFVVSLVGIYLGHRAGLRFRTPAEVVGGLILVLIGTKILVEHLDLL